MIATKEPVYQYYERDGDPIRTAVELHGHRRFLRGRYGNDKLLIDFVLKPDSLGEGEYYRRERWTSSLEADIIGEGYKLTDGLVTGLAWRRIGVYCRIHNDRWFDCDAHEGEKDADGYPLYSLDTATTLCDFLETNAEKQFIRSLGRGLDSDGMMKILGIAAVAVVGVVVASLMGVFRWN